MFSRAIALSVTCGALAFGCGSEPQVGSPEEQQEIIDNLVEAGFPQDDIMIADGKVYVGRDAEVSLAASREMIANPGEGEEQFRTTNQVGTNITVICVNGSAFTGTLSTGLNDAIANYNNLGLRWTMRRITTSTTGCSAVITARTTSGTGGSAGFPTGGRPFGTINIGTGVASLGVNVAEHVITHELGHCIGFRHSDFFNRAISCGGAASNEGQAGVGAILVPGTPSTAVVGGSIMNSCFRSSENGEFTGSDVTALNAMY